ncbi:MAG: gliding motility-associated C-terminal domain-containing protein, partial [Putridiphycobacter sp.]|nr:gliding motility-associated C-terminal domain-containing protein [Putridiphycobacter sp.]
ATTFYITNIAGDTLNEDPNTPGGYLNVINTVNSGTYIVYATDEFGCEAANQFNIPEPFPGPISAGFTTVDPDCHQTAEGVILVTSVFNTDTDIDDVQFNWAPIPSGNPTNGPGRNSLIDCLPGEYTLVLTDLNGCSNDTVIFINDKDPLTANLTVASKTYCRTAGWQSGNGVVAAENVPDSSGTGSLMYTWRHLTTNVESNNSTFVVRDPGNLELTIVDGLGCTFIDTIYVDSINPVADFILTSDGFYTEGIYEGEEELKIRLENLSTGFAQANNPNSDTIFQINFNTDSVNDQSKWFFTYDIDDRPDTSYFGVNVNTTTIYNVCLIAKNFNDCVDTMCQEVTVHRIPEFIAPNVFTPGTVPNNDFYFPAVGYPVFNATVFNRYGVAVYEFNSVLDKWDGNHYKTGKPCVDGVYSYTYRAETSKGTVLEGNGQVHLIRHKP